MRSGQLDIHFVAVGGIGIITILEGVHQPMLLFIISPLTDNTNIGSLEVGVHGNGDWFCHCCHCRKLSASREYKGKSDGNAVSITISAFHGQPHENVGSSVRQALFLIH